jgi:hypothetical protein
MTCHNFIQQVPKCIALYPNESLKQGGGGCGYKRGKDGRDKKFVDKKDIITDDDKNQKKMEGRTRRKLYQGLLFQSKEVPKNKNGKLICMNFFLRGFCEASCNRIHKLTVDDKKAFDKFVNDCQAANEDDEKSDF